ncbi:MAG: TlpA family protein disulfide reductase [Ferruginibacter sp.]
MKTFFIFLLFSRVFSANAQDVPSLQITDIDENYFQTSSFTRQDNKLIVLSFWATWCIPCISELSSINDNMETWKKESDFDFYAISIDDSRGLKRVKPLANGKGWSLVILSDKNQAFKRALNLGSIPYTLVIKNGKIIHRLTGYTEGDEFDLYKIIKNNQ